MKTSNFNIKIFYFIFAIIILLLFVRMVYFLILKLRKKKIYHKRYKVEDIIKLDYELKYKNDVKYIIIEKRNGNYEKALNILNELEEKDGISTSTLSMRAKIYSCQQRFDEAIELYKIIHEYYIKNFGDIDIASEENLYYLLNRDKMSKEEFTDFLRRISGNENYKLISKNKIFKKY